VATEFQQEFLCQVESECQSLIEAHWEDIALHKDRISLNPDWDLYHEAEDVGKLKIFTARSCGVLVGYFVVFVSYNPHYKDHLFATNDVIYLHKDFRKGLVGLKLIKFAETCLRADGVSVLLINTKVHQPFDPILDRLNFNLIERVYSKYLGD
jgi:GNAT superfamily N-acetyltransferase